jgi:hypothetical protein
LRGSRKPRYGDFEHHPISTEALLRITSISRVKCDGQSILGGKPSSNLTAGNFEGLAGIEQVWLASILNSQMLS